MDFDFDFDFETEPLGRDSDGNDVFLKDIWPSSKEISDVIAHVRKPPYFDGMPAEPEPVTDISGARALALLGDSVTGCRFVWT
jgi:aconitate hydratase